MTAQRPAELVLYETLKERIQNIPTDMDFWLVATTYANGCRIKETCNLTFADFEWNNDFLYIHSQVLKKKMNKKTGVKPIPKRNNPIDRKLEPWITEPIIAFIEAKRGSPNNQQKVWDKTKITAQRHINKYLNFTSHSLRHNRATHLMIKFGYGMRDLLEFFKIEPRTIAAWSVRYGHLERSYLEEKFKKMRGNPILELRVAEDSKNH
jgi:integrase